MHIQGLKNKEPILVCYPILFDLLLIDPVDHAGPSECLKSR